MACSCWLCTLVLHFLPQMAQLINRRVCLTFLCGLASHTLLALVMCAIVDWISSTQSQTGPFRCLHSVWWNLQLVFFSCCFLEGGLVSRDAQDWYYCSWLCDWAWCDQSHHLLSWSAQFLLLLTWLFWALGPLLRPNWWCNLRHYPTCNQDSISFALCNTLIFPLPFWWAWFGLLVRLWG